jgi:hypothetical protein
MLGLNDFTDMPDAIKPLPDYTELWADGTRLTSCDGAARWGLEASMIHAIDNTANKPVFLKRSYGATSLYAAWRPVWDPVRAAVTGEVQANHQYPKLVADIADAIGDREINTAVFVWLQGEKDCKLVATAADYAAGLDNMLTTLQVDTGLTFGKAIIGRVRPFPDITYPEKATVRAAQDATPATTPGGIPCVVVDLDAITPVDALHYDAPGYVDTGELYAAEV